jgi:hypothetical protein
MMVPLSASGQHARARSYARARTRTAALLRALSGTKSKDQVDAKWINSLQATLARNLCPPQSQRA